MEQTDLRFVCGSGSRRLGGVRILFALALASALSAAGQSADEDPLPPLPPVDPNRELPVDWSGWLGVPRLLGVSQVDYRSSWSYSSDLNQERGSEQNHTTVFMELEFPPPQQFFPGSTVWWRVVSANASASILSSYSSYALGGGVWAGGEGVLQGSYSGPLSLRIEPDLRFSLSDGTGQFVTLREPAAPWGANSVGSVTQWTIDGPVTRNFSEVEIQRGFLEYLPVNFTAPKAVGPFSGRSVVEGPSGDGSGRGEGSFRRTASFQFWPDWNDLEVRVEIEDATQPGTSYAEWRPEGNLETPDQGGPRPLRLKATLRPKAESPTPQQLAAIPPVRRFRFELSDISREPGVCLNWPLPPGTNAPPDDPEFDLRFIATIPQAMVLSPKKSKAGVIPLPGEDPNLPSSWVLLECFDFGAHANLQVYADLADGREIVGHLKVGEEKRYLIPIPDRDPGTLVARKWREDNKVRAGDEDDLDDQPTGDGQKGDGFCVYEEYRGFRVNGKHVTLDPAVKDLFVRNYNGGPVAAACRLLEVKTREGDRKGLKVHYELESDEWHDSRVMNPNRNANSPKSSNEPQHGLAVVPSTASGDAIISFADIKREPWRPKNTERVVIHPKDNTVETVIHEIAHAIGVEHHGNVDYHAQWLVLEVTSANGTKLRRFFEQEMTSDPKTGTLTPTGVPGLIRVFREGASRETLPDQSTNAPPPAPTRKYIARRGGQHSGMEKCFMRYDCAGAYVPAGRPLDRITFQRADLVDFSEGEIFSFCKNCQGTGVNPARFGHATAGHCFSQLCVRDTAPARPVTTGKCPNTP